MQQTLLPNSLEDYVNQENPVRVIEVFIDELDLAGLGFSGITRAATGRPAYHPATLLKIYLYGYLNRLESSRRLEREAQRNIELMWLVGRLAPDFKTIADFRKDNGAAIQGGVSPSSSELCRRLGPLHPMPYVAIDGSKFKAVNNRDKNYAVAKVTGRMEARSRPSIARLPAGTGPGRPPRGRCRRGQVGPAEGEDCRPAPADAGPEGDRAEGSGTAPDQQVSADRSRRPFDEQLDAGDVGAVIGGEEHRRLAEIVRRADPAERNRTRRLRAFSLIRHQN